MANGYKEKESTLNKNVVKWLNSLRLCKAYKRKGSAYNRGQADVSGCLCGIRIELEGKVGDNKPTKLQKHWLAKWHAAGAITGVYWSLDDAKMIIAEQAAERGLNVRIVF